MLIFDRRMAILDLMALPRNTLSKRNRHLPTFVSQQVVASKRYFLDLQPQTLLPLTVVCGGEELVRSDYLIQRDRFPYYCIEFVASGHGTAVLNGRTVMLNPGSIFSYGPDLPHVIRTDKKKRMRKYYIDFVGSSAFHALSKAHLKPGSHLTVSSPDEVRTIFELMQQCGIRSSSHSQSLCSQLLGVLLTKITEGAFPPESIDLTAHKTFEAFKAFLCDQRQRLTSIELAADEFGISPAYLCRLFKRFGEQSPYRYLLRQRMSLAADYLTHECLQVQQTARRLGYTDPYQFSKAFKRVAGISPQHFQKRTANRRSDGSSIK